MEWAKAEVEADHQQNNPGSRLGAGGLLTKLNLNHCIIKKQYPLT